VVAFLGALRDTPSPAAEEHLTDTLGWLWDTVAGPVLDRLGITGPPPGERWPQLWWCPSGLLSFLPLHAAGHHNTRDDPAPATVVDRVVSSYTPTVRALAHVRRAALNDDDLGDTTDVRNRVVAVVMPHTPGASDLPGAQTEATRLQRRFPGQVSLLTGLEVTHDAVLAALPTTAWAHFACHASADLTNPSASQLLLTDHQTRPLTVVDIARQRLDDAELAFLSACETARPGTRLTDEAIHLTSAFQLAGYRHVIGTLWPIGDQHAVDIADDIYTTLACTGDVAAAVHAATRRQRHRWDMPSVWASHIHVGP
jgi:CHAT domain-containing protein